MIDRMARFGLDSPLTVSQLVMSHLFDRFPDLRVFVAESRVGWLPFWFENADLQYDRNIFWCSRDLGLEPQLIDEIYANVPEPERYQILRGNAIRFFKLEHQRRHDQLALPELTAA